MKGTRPVLPPWIWNPPLPLPLPLPTRSPTPCCPPCATVALPDMGSCAETGFVAWLFWMPVPVPSCFVVSGCLRQMGLPFSFFALCLRRSELPGSWKGGQVGVGGCWLGVLGVVLGYCAQVIDDGSPWTAGRAGGRPVGVACLLTFLMLMIVSCLFPWLFVDECHDEERRGPLRRQFP